MKYTAILLLTLSLSAPISVNADEESNASSTEKSLIDLLFNSQSQAEGCATYPKCDIPESELMIIEQELRKQRYDSSDSTTKKN